MSWCSHLVLLSFCVILQLNCAFLFTIATKLHYSLPSQNENSGMWVHGPGSRAMSAVPSTYYGFQGQNQQHGGFRQGQQPSQQFGALGYPNFYHSQAGMSLEHQQQSQREASLGGSQGGQPSKQSQQLWQNSYWSRSPPGFSGSCSEFQKWPNGGIFAVIIITVTLFWSKETLSDCCPVPRGCILHIYFLLPFNVGTCVLIWVRGLRPCSFLSLSHFFFNPLVSPYFLFYSERVCFPSDNYYKA